MKSVKFGIWQTRVANLQFGRQWINVSQKKGFSILQGLINKDLFSDESQSVVDIDRLFPGSPDLTGFDGIRFHYGSIEP